MGCAASSVSKMAPAGIAGVGGVGKMRRRKKRVSAIPRVAVFVPSLRVPVQVDFFRPLRGLVPRELLDRLSTLRDRVVTLAEQSVLSVVPELRRALEDYLPVLLGLTKKEYRLDALVEFKWKNIEGDGRETGFECVWYEVLSAVHFMAMLSLLEANMVLLRTTSLDSTEVDISEGSKKDAIDLLIRAAGYLDYCISDLQNRLPLNIRYNLPSDLQDAVMESIAVQALGQAVEIQLGLAASCEKATLSVKRRLACEEVSYFAQAHYCLSGGVINDVNGRKHLLFLKWKYMEAKVAAYYYHGLLLDKNSEPDNQISAVNCILAADELLTDSKKSCLSFCLAAPVTRVPPAWGVMKHLHKKVPEVASVKYQMYGYLFEQEKTLQSLPDLPEFSLSLRPDDYELPDFDAAWDDERYQPVIQSLKQHLKDDEDLGSTTL